MSKTFYMIAVVVVFLGCQRESFNVAPLPPAAQPEPSTVEGIVTYFVGGGTVEMPYPPGFILMNSQWITHPPDSWYGRIYLAGMIDSSYIGNHVRAVGIASQAMLSGTLPQYKSWIINFRVDSLRILDQASKPPR